MRTIAIINQKGGCGKTTTAINLAGVLARQGRRTLLVDLDPQSHCAAGLAIPEARIDVQIGDAMMARADQAIDWTRLLWRVSRSLDLAPSTVRLAALESARGGLAGAENAETRLAGVLTRLADQYEFCLIDCPPNIGLLTYNALAAATEVIIPVETAFFALQGATKQIAAIKSLAKRLNVSPAVRVLPTMHDGKSSLAEDVLEELTRRFADALVPVVIRHDARLKEAVSFGQPIVDYAGESTGSQDYAALAAWMLTDAGKLKPAGTTPVRAASPSIQIGPSVAPTRSTPIHTPPPLPSVVPMPGALTGMVAANGQGTSTAARVISRPAASVSNGAAAGLKPVIVQTAQPASRVIFDQATGSTTVAVLENPVVAPADQGAIAEPKPSPTSTTAEEIRSRLLELTSRVSRLAERTGGGSATDVPAPSARKAHGDPSPLFGVRNTASGSLFVQPGDSATTIFLAGEFNNWSATATPLNRNELLGVFERTLPLPPGRYCYRLVIDGRWGHDVHNPVSEPNPFGELNSILEVPVSRGRL